MWALNKWCVTKEAKCRWKIVDLAGPLLIDVFQQPRLLLNGVGIGIKLWPSLEAFRLMSDSLSSDKKGPNCRRFFQTGYTTIRRRTYSVEQKSAKNTASHLSIFTFGNQDNVNPIWTIQFQRR